MMDQLGEDLRLAEIAAEARLSPFHFCRSFKATTGLTPAQWLLHKRVQRAVELLRDTDLPLAEIALEVGYANQSAFTAAFSRVMKIAPGAFRRAVA
jgi:AraC family transcriptional regulator